VPESQRADFFLYVDEFQNFATESFANILSEARKYRLDLTMAHQYMEQLDETVLAAVIGNVGSLITFRVGSTDAEILAKEFIPTFIEEDLVNLPKFHIYLKLMIDGVSSRPFSAITLPPIAKPTGSEEKVVRVSRERYAVRRDSIEDKIARWSGMLILPDDTASQMDVDEDEAMFIDKPLEKKENETEDIGKEEIQLSQKQNTQTQPEPQIQPSVVRQAENAQKNNFITRDSQQRTEPNQQATHNQQFGQQNITGKKKRRRKRHKNGNFQQANIEQTSPVEIVDSSQRGISLSSLAKKEEKQSFRVEHHQNDRQQNSNNNLKTIKPGHISRFED
jgi:hypothetical protein